VGEACGLREPMEVSEDVMRQARLRAKRLRTRPIVPIVEAWRRCFDLDAC
jgi:hypothetical protein